jgi:phenylalanyl-tRNA synthetase beta subunit
VPSLLGVLGKNARSGARVFEWQVYCRMKANNSQRVPAPGNGSAATAAQQAHWQKNAARRRLFSLKAVVEDHAFGTGRSALQWRAASEARSIRRCARLSIDSQRRGVLGEVHPDVAARYDLADAP